MQIVSYWMHSKLLGEVQTGTIVSLVWTYHSSEHITHLNLSLIWTYHSSEHISLVPRLLCSLGMRLITRLNLSLIWAPFGPIMFGNCHVTLFLLHFCKDKFLPISDWSFNCDTHWQFDHTLHAHKHHTTPPHRRSSPFDCFLSQRTLFTQ